MQVVTGKVIVHEWAHLRWGVFDESGGDGYPDFYINKDGQVEANRLQLKLCLVYFFYDKN